MKKDSLFIIFILVGILIPGILAIPETLSLHGKLTNSTGSILTGTYNMTFKIYDVSAGGSALWQSVNQTVSVASDGIYNFILKDINLTFAEQYYLGIAVGTDDEMTPRINLTSTPYTFRAGNISAEGIINDSNVNLVGKNITASSGLFTWLGSLLNRITELFVQDITFNGSINGSGNITTTGRIGIGTGSPDVLLHLKPNVGGNVLIIDESDSNTDAVRIQAGPSGGDFYLLRHGNFQIKIPATGVVVFNEQGIATHDFRIESDTNENMFFVDAGENAVGIGYNDTDLSETTGKLLVDGNVGINTTSPTHTLNVDGTMNVTGASIMGNVSFNGGWENNGVSILDGDIYAQTGYFYNITSLNVTKKNLTVIENLTVGGHLFSSGTGNNYFMGNLGIGTGSPSAKLEINKADASTGPALRLSNLADTINDGAILGSIEFFSGDNSVPADEVKSSIIGYVNPSDERYGELAFNVGTNVEAMRIEQSGNVGIGTTTPAYRLEVADVEKALNVSGVLYVNGTSGNVGIGTASPSSELEVKGTNPSVQVMDSGETYNWYFGINETDNSKLYIGAGYGPEQAIAPAIVVDSSLGGGTYGNVGIGTASPSEELEVIGEIRAPYSIDALNRYIQIYHAGDSVGARIMAAGIASQPNGQKLNLYVNGSDRLTIDRDGNVGIGTTSPTEELQIDGADAVIRLNSTAAGGQYWDLHSRQIDGSFRITNESGDTFMTFLPSGNVGIGTASPAYRLEIADVEKALNVSGVLYVNGTSGNVGIGTASPNSKLELSSDGTNTYIRIDADAAQQSALEFTKDSSQEWIIYQPGGSEDLRIYDADGAADDVVTFQSGGNVGIGTASPTHELTVKSAASNNVVFNVERSNEVKNLFSVTEDGDEDAYVRVRDKNDAIGVQLHSSGYSFFTGGNVGIGTTSPTQAKLVVNTGLTDSGRVGFFDTALDANSEYAYLHIGNNATGTAIDKAAIFGYLHNTDNDLKAAFMSVPGLDPATGGGIYINKLGNVGIGTTTPGEELEVAGDINSTGGDICITGGNCLSGGGVPSGMIGMFNSSCPSGWNICDGTSGTVNLTNKFIRAETTPGNTGGSDDAVVVTHTHQVDPPSRVSGTESADHYHLLVTLTTSADFLSTTNYLTYKYDGGGDWNYQLKGSDNPAGVARSGSQSESHTHTTDIPEFTSGSAGEDGTDKNMPAYYSLIFCMKA